MTKDEEKIIVKKITSRDEKITLSFINTHKKSLFYFIFRQINDFHTAEELTQDVFFDFIEALRDFHFQSSLKTFLYTIAKNKVIDHIRKKKIKKILFSMLPVYVVEGLKTVFIDDEIEKKELERKINHVFTRLPNDYRVILRLKYIEGEKVRAIAEKLSLGFKTTESLLFRARRAFIKIFNALP